MAVFTAGGSIGGWNKAVMAANAVNRACSWLENSPAGEFSSHEQARLTALAAITALFQPPMEPQAVDTAMTSAPLPSRRAFLGLGR